MHFAADLITYDCNRCHVHKNPYLIFNECDHNENGGIVERAMLRHHNN